MIDVLVIGSGGAGLTAALAAGAKGASVLVAGKGYPTNSQTSMAQGGINAALGNAGEDSVEAHIADTLKSAHGLCDEVMVKTMCSRAAETITWLESIGLPFSRTAEAKVAQRQLGGAGQKRACYSQDYTGLKILHTLYDTCLREGIDFLDEHYLLSLTTTESGGERSISGVILLDIASGEVKELHAKTVIIATGGYGSLYYGFTTNACGSTGDGISAVVRAGGTLSDLEFVQFHPTALKSSSILISESARGEGGYLLNGRGERFVDELLPRDIVARAIYDQISAGEQVYLDIRHLGEEKLSELLPQELHLCRLHEGVDPVTELIPVKPVAHYAMGGIDVRRSLEVKGIKGCFAVGECSNAKVHGANRLGGNSLLEIIAFGKIAGDHAAAAAAAAAARSTFTAPAERSRLKESQAFVESCFKTDPSDNFYEARDRLGALFYHQAGIVRDADGLEHALADLLEIRKMLPLMGVEDRNRRYNTNLIDFLEFLRMLELGEMLLTGALHRRESRGAHYRKDFPREDDLSCLAHTCYRREGDNILVTLERSYE